MSKKNIILGIESSCDDTSAAVISDGYILSNIVAGQKVHEKYGGVVPELASRAHQQNIIPVVDTALKEAGIQKEDLSAIAFTQGPGLLGSLLVGSSFSKSFALGMNIPLIAVNHMQGHIMAHFIKQKGEENKQPIFPFLCLTVSGGHTQIVLVKSAEDMTVIGETLDDAAGEAFDKSAKILGLPYPGGPLIDKYGEKGDKLKFIFGRHKVGELNFSYSGIKTSILRVIEKGVAENPNFITENQNDLCASIQHTIVDILIKKIMKASKEFGVNEVAIAGGVSANSYLRERLLELESNYNKQVFIPKFEYCTDNAAMIAISGYYKFLKGDFSDQSVTPKSRFAL
ncbi:MAG: tRNA (adenosine(37)-N6)-threonylcarbamoyltransferase complex transferase subunit TsaD [Flavobacteriales bacterium]|jgi:N6-L-threonylcarbamoyladenine synthase|nr:tRNA (adenosine(37)-N6)-threonylcarbamoyltransferase complex transferase subunit TsaD [Flavobacteriales bacterium]MBT6013805.1 tRNA (adenosine(37)-N6)-threonylcarbamoyltransferase complex transferase subunit TsaD [Flavobacteriales bacterium]MBT7481839.1 tRNA (adenosine(37)-N6)-threonylcarbamoyltransferase complex transferase subunit TsaD [Flavobacteriales bacterium]